VCGQIVTTFQQGCISGIVSPAKKLSFSTERPASWQCNRTAASSSLEPVAWDSWVRSQARMLNPRPSFDGIACKSGPFSPYAEATRKQGTPSGSPSSPRKLPLWKAHADPLTRSSATLPRRARSYFGANQIFAKDLPALCASSFPSPKLDADPLA
jgi:hypothetical protein